jgi:hypothetical protein
VRSWPIGNQPRTTGDRSRPGPARRLLALAVLLAIALATPASAAAGALPERLIAPRDECPEQAALDAPKAVQVEAMRCLADYAREEFGLPPLADARELDWSAEAKAGDILSCDSFSHDACGRDFTFWMEESGYLRARCWRAGENLASGGGRAGTARAAFVALMRSPTHRRNILGRYDRIGIGLRAGHLNGRGDTNVWVQHFGTHCREGTHPGDVRIKRDAPTPASHPLDGPDHRRARPPR